MKTLSRRALLVAVALLGASPALALPKERDLAANARVEDADGRALDLATLKGKTYLVVYDDKTSAPKGEPFRMDLVKQLKASGTRPLVKLVFVADVSSFNFWPARGIVLDAVRDATRKVGTTVYCDWTGGLRDAYKFKSEATSIVLVGKDGRVALTHEGIPAGADKQRLLDAINKAANAS